MKKVALLGVAITLFAAGVAQAGTATEISVNVLLYPLKGFGPNDANGNPSPTAPCKTVLVVDKDGDGLAGFGLSAAAPWSTDAPTDTFLFDANDWLVVGKTRGEWHKNETTGSFGLNTYIDTSAYTYKFDLDYSGDTPLTGPDYLNAGDHLWLFWFPTLTGTAITSDSPGQDKPFGAIDLGGLPGAGGSKGFLDGDEVWGVPDRVPVYSTAPEPATLVLTLLGGGLVALRRRRHA